MRFTSAWIVEDDPYFCIRYPNLVHEDSCVARELNLVNAGVMTPNEVGYGTG